MRLFITFITILGALPTLVRWTVQGRISVEMAAIFAVGLVALLSMGSRAFRIFGPIIALVAFGLQYADDGTWQNFWAPIIALLPLSVALFGIFIMFRGFSAKRQRED